MEGCQWELSRATLFRMVCWEAGMKASQARFPGRG
jgi:hypothetical protein